MKSFRTLVGLIFVSILLSFPNLSAKEYIPYTSQDDSSYKKDVKIYTGLSHTHSWFGDGGKTIQRLREYGLENGLDFIIVTEHAQSIDKEEKEINLKKVLTGKVGFANYLRECRANSDDKLIVIPGAEFGDVSHYLVLGLYDPAIFYAGLKIHNEQGQSAAIDYFMRKGLCVIAAHPDMVRKVPKREGLGWELISYIFDFAGVNLDDYGNINLHGIEVFNNGTEDTLEDNLRHVQGRTLNRNAILAGCDYHTAEAEAAAEASFLAQGGNPYYNSLRRLTLVWGRKNTNNLAEQILGQIMQGHTAALYMRSNQFDVSWLPYCYEPGTGYFGDINRYTKVVHSVPPFIRGEYSWISGYHDPNSPNPEFTVISRRVANGEIYIDNQKRGSYMLHLKTNYYELVGSYFGIG